MPSDSSVLVREEATNLTVRVLATVVTQVAELCKQEQRPLDASIPAVLIDELSRSVPPVEHSPHPVRA